jgi:hypothetical protein
MRKSKFISVLLMGVAVVAHAGSKPNAPNDINNFNAAASAAAVAGGALLPVGGTAVAAVKLQTARVLSMTGDVTWTSPSFDGTGNVTAAGTLATVNSNVGACGSTGAYPIVTLDAKGRATACSTQAVGSAAFASTGASGHLLPYLDVADTFSANVTFSGGLVSSGANTFGNTGSNFEIGGVTSASRNVTFNNFGQPTYTYNDNSLNATLGTLNNYSITGINQGARVGTFNYGSGGTLGGQAAGIYIYTTDTWALAANRSVKFEVDLMTNGTIQTDSLTFDPAAGLKVGGRLVMPGIPITMANAVNNNDADYAPAIGNLGQIVSLVGTITATRTFTLPACQTGQHFRIMRTGGGAFNWTIGSKSLAQNQWLDEYCSSGVFIETGFGSL